MYWVNVIFIWRQRNYYGALIRATYLEAREISPTPVVRRLASGVAGGA